MAVNFCDINEAVFKCCLKFFMIKLASWLVQVDKCHLILKNSIFYIQSLLKKFTVDRTTNPSLLGFKFFNYKEAIRAFPNHTAGFHTYGFIIYIKVEILICKYNRLPQANDHNYLVDNTAQTVQLTIQSTMQLMMQ